MKFVPWWWKALLCLVIAITLLVGGWWYQSEKKRVEALISSQLETVSKLEAEAIKAWKFERKGDALVLSANPLIKDFLLSYQPNMSADEINRKFFRLVNYLNEISKSYRYEDVILTDTKGRVLISGKDTKVLDESAIRALEKALELKEPIITDLHVAEESHHPHAGVIAGVFDEATGKAIGALALKQDAKDFLYSVLEIMPIPRKTAESILLKKDGNEVLFLSELKGRADSALKLRIPLSQQGDIAVMAINGAEGFNRGRGYNGEEVLAFILPIPDSSWKLITQIESKEIFPFISRPSLQIFWILVLVILFSLAGFIGIKERYKKAHFRALNRVNERFGVTLRSIGDAVIVTDADGIVEMLNPVAEQLTGWSDGEARGKKLQEIFHIVNEETREEVENPVTRVLREGVVVGLANHTLLISKDGREIPIADSGAPIRTPDGSITGVVLVFRDQSAERKAQEEIKKAKEFAESIVATVRESLVVLDSSLKIVSANRHFCSTFDVTPPETVGKSIFEISNRRWDNPQLRKLLEDILPFNKHLDDFEVAYTDEFGNKRSFLLNGHRLYSEHGKTEKILLALEEITERRRQEEGVKRYGSLLKATLDSTEDGILVVDRKGKVTIFNQRFLELWRIPEELAEGRDDNKLLAFVYDQLKEPEKFMAKVRELYSKPEEVSFDEIYFKDGRVFERYSQPQRLEKEIVGRVWSFRDVTEKRKALEEWWRSRNQATVGKVAEGVAHDINNHLQVITASAEMLGRDIGIKDIFEKGNGKKEGARNQLYRIQKAVESCKSICKNLLVLARQMAVELEPTDLNDCVAKYYTELGGLGREDIPVRIDLTKEALPVLMDTTALNRSLINLVRNAIDAIGTQGEICISTFAKEIDEEFCKSYPQAKPGKYAVVAVSDTGCGIAEETRERLFVDFFTTKKDGAGVGLSIVHEMVTQSGGFVRVLSELGKGSTFELYFPVYEGAVSKTQRAEKVFPLVEGKTILVVEDNPEVLDSLCALLESCGHTPLPTSHPKQAIEIAKSHKGKIHLLLTDVLLPHMNGKELHETIKRIHPNIKCLFMSGYPENVISPIGVTPADVGFIWKPFESAKLLKKLQELLEESLKKEV